MYAFTGIEDNTKEEMSWQRRANANVVEYWRTGKRTLYFFNDETSRRTRDSKYMRYTYRLTNPEQCVFSFQHKTEFSKGESLDDFSAYSFIDTDKFNFANSHKFEFIDEGWRNYILLEGPRVFCDEQAEYCQKRVGE
jgi:hypothetical protein